MSWDELTITDEQELDSPTYSDPQEMNRLFFKVFSTEDGDKVLNYMIAMTLDQPCFIPGESASYGYCREGQNSIVRDIIKRVKRGRG
tara:strand:+ start:6132 stop:6392 length:261 start_codon:yes stop_codon:yes gene_type:complete